LDVEKRLEIAKNNVGDNPLFQFGTCILDGTITPVDFDRSVEGFSHEQWFSYKTKHTGMNQLVCALSNAIIKSVCLLGIMSSKWMVGMVFEILSCCCQ
jgi:hypothetical protein